MSFKISLTDFSAFKLNSCHRNAFGVLKVRLFLWEASAALTLSFTLTCKCHSFNHNQLTFSLIYVEFSSRYYLSTLFQFSFCLTSPLIFCMLFFVMIMHPHPLPQTLPHPLFPFLTSASYSGWSQSKCLSRPLVLTVF